jgi:DNA-binding IclR family transcriptional regulator
MLEQVSYSPEAALRSTHLSLGRGLHILEIIAESGKTATLSDTARKANLPRSTAYHIMQTLVRLGYLTQDTDSRNYQLAPKIFNLSGKALSIDKLAEIALPYLTEVCDRTGESAVIAVLREDRVNLVAKRDADGPVRIVQDASAQRPIHSTALGKVLTAWLDPQQLSGLISAMRFERFTAKTIIQRNRFEQELRRVRTCGTAYDNEEFIAGVRCIAAPVFGYNNEVIAALGATGPKTHLQQQKLRDCAPLIQHCANALSEHLGGNQSTR